MCWIGCRIFAHFALRMWCGLGNLQVTQPDMGDKGVEFASWLLGLGGP